MSRTSATPNSTALLATSTLTFLVLYAVVSLKEPLLAGAPILLCTGALLAGLMGLATSQQLGNAQALTWIMVLLSAPVTARLMMVGISWDVGMQVAPLCGALVGAYALAGLRSSEKPVVVPPTALPEGVWGETVLQARNAHQQLLREMQAHALGGPTLDALRDKSATLLTGVERTATGWARMERNASTGLDGQVKAQLESVQRLLAETTDEVARHEYQRTAEALQAQQEAISRIRRNGERALARVRCQVALLETARLSVMAYAAQERTVQGEDATRLAMMLESATQELDLTAGALEEAQGSALQRASA